MGAWARVLLRVERIIDEKTGRMLRIKRDTAILENVIGTGQSHRSCPRAIYPYWREAWLRRVEGQRVTATGPLAAARRGVD